ncbi:MAG: metal-sensitive transcriptional regulator [Chloroflexi bacterium]|nr:metal-sensitive transcriptional regulator [Chloroflexota bacterium]
MPFGTEPRGNLHLSPAVQDDLVRRLRRLEGQARGVQRMLQEQRDCREILAQLAAIRSAADRASLLLARDHALECLHDPTRSLSTEDVITELVSTLVKLPADSVGN